tara:strand:+ start:21152 stop:22249 length:1098 start_codon:yes stop_codon:yes gene_type:complete
VTSEVAVVGGGVSGAAATIALQRAGVAVSWVAPKPESCLDAVGETLAPAANPILKRLGLGDVLISGAHRPSNTTLSSWGSEQLIDRNAILHLEGPGMVLNRNQFDADIRASALSVAADYQPASLGSLKTRASKWQLTLTDGTEIFADAVIDATGRKATIGRRFCDRKRVDQLAAVVAFLRQGRSFVEPTQAVLIEAVAAGWWYAALLPDKRLSVGFYTDPDLIEGSPRGDLQAWKSLIEETIYIGRWIADAEFEIGSPPKLFSAGTTWLNRASGMVDGAPWMAIGDSAAAFDPLSSHGITTALWAGEQAGQVIPSLFSGNAFALENYSMAVRTGVMRFLEQRQLMYSIEQRFTEATFWQRRHSAG